MDAAAMRQCLINAGMPDNATRNAAEEALKQSFAADPATHFVLLAQDLADETSPSPEARAQAGLILKNHLTSRDRAQDLVLANDWMALNPEVRGRVKAGSVGALGSQHNAVRLAAAQVIAKIATIELPKPGQWDDLMQTLLDYVVKPEASPAGMARREAALNTIGYICEEIAQLETTCLEARSNEILTAVVAGMRADEPRIKVAATKALTNALEFAAGNFDVDNERDYLMTVICEACTQGNLDDVKESAFQCLERIAELYYRKLPKYIQTILDITIQAINTQEDAVARQAINVWVQVCDVEYDFESDADAPGHHEFIKGASQYLIPVLLQTMSKQEDDQDSEAFNKSTEAAWCLNSIATVIEKDIIPYVVPWVHQNISSADWRCKEAAVMAYGCILDGLNNKESSLGQHAPAVMDLCLGYIKDEAVTLVKDSSAWTINKVCETDHAFETILGPQFADRIQRMLEVMHTAEPSTSVHLATALRHTAENILRICENEAENMPPDFPLAHVFQVIVECLYATADRKDADENGLRHECYEAMNSVLDSINANKVADQWKPTCIQIVQQYIIPNLLPRFGERLNAELGKNVLNSDDVNARTEWVAYFCGAIQMSICALSDKSMLIVQDANQQTVADKFMTLFLQVFQFQNTTVAAEAILAVNQILNQLGEDFERYMAAFVPVLVGCLCVVQDVQLCRNAIATVSDLACLLKEKVLPYGDAIVQAMLGIFANPAVDADIQQIHDYIKPVACSAIGDLARELGKGMDKYLAAFLETLHTVSTNTARLRQELSAVAEPDEDKMEYLNAMIAGVLDGYTGILYGLADAEKNDAPGAVDAFCQPKALDQGAFLMIQEVALAGNGNYDLLGDEALSKAVGLVGDMAMNFKGRQHAAQIKAMLSVEHVKALLQKGKDSTDEDLKGLAQWTEIQLQGMA